ncbi:MAG: hypothetical protein AAF228_06965 [Pseudomonadota bacterium]
MSSVAAINPPAGGVNNDPQNEVGGFPSPATTLPPGAAPSNDSSSSSADPDFAFTPAPDAFDIFFGDKTSLGYFLGAPVSAPTSLPFTQYLESTDGGSPPQGRYGVGVVLLDDQYQLVMVDQETEAYTLLNQSELTEYGFTVDSTTGEITLADDVYFSLLNDGMLRLIKVQDSGDEVVWSFDFAAQSSADAFDIMFADKHAHVADDSTLFAGDTLGPAEYLEIDDQFYFASAEVDGEHVWFLTDKNTGNATLVDFSDIEGLYVETDATSGTLSMLLEGYQLNIVAAPNADGVLEARVQVATEGGSVPWYSDASGSYLNVVEASHILPSDYFDAMTPIGSALSVGSTLNVGEYFESPDGVFRGTLAEDGDLLIVDTRTNAVVESLETGAVGGSFVLSDFGTNPDAILINTLEFQLNDAGTFQMMDTRFDPTQNDGLLWDSSLITDKTDLTTGVIKTAPDVFSGAALGSTLEFGEQLKAGDGNYLEVSADIDGDGTIDVNFRTTLLSDGRLLTFDMIEGTVVTEATIDTGLTDAVLEVRSDGGAYIFPEGGGSGGYVAYDMPPAWSTGTGNKDVSRNDFSFGLAIDGIDVHLELRDTLYTFDDPQGMLLYSSDITVTPSQAEIGPVLATGETMELGEDLLAMDGLSRLVFIEGASGEPNSFAYQTRSSTTETWETMWEADIGDATHITVERYGVIHALNADNVVTWSTPAPAFTDAINIDRTFTLEVKAISDGGGFVFIDQLAANDPDTEILWQVNADGTEEIAAIAPLARTDLPSGTGVIKTELVGQDDALLAGDVLRSPDGAHKAVLTDSGDFVIYRLDETFDTDGNAVAQHVKIWSTDIQGAASVKVLDNGNVVALDANDAIIWQSNTEGAFADRPFTMTLLNSGQFEIVDTSQVGDVGDGVIARSSGSNSIDVLNLPAPDITTDLSVFPSYLGADDADLMRPGDALQLNEQYLFVFQPNLGLSLYDMTTADAPTLIWSGGEPLSPAALSSGAAENATLKIYQNGNMEVRKADGAVLFTTNTGNDKANRGDFRLLIDTYTDGDGNDTARVVLYDLQAQKPLWTSDAGTLDTAASNEETGTINTPPPPPANIDTKDPDDKDDDKDKHKSPLDDWPGFWPFPPPGPPGGPSGPGGGDGGGDGGSDGTDGSDKPKDPDAPKDPGGSGNSGSFTDPGVQHVQQTVGAAAEMVMKAAGDAALEMVEVAAEVAAEDAEMAEALEAAAESLQAQIEAANAAVEIVTNAETVGELEVGVEALKGASLAAATVVAETAGAGTVGVEFVAGTAAAFIAADIIALGAVAVAQLSLGTTPAMNQNVDYIKTNTQSMIDTLIDSGSLSELQDALRPLFDVVTNLNETLFKVQGANLDTDSLNALISLTESIAPQYASLTKDLIEAAKAKSSQIEAVLVVSEVTNPLFPPSQAVVEAQSAAVDNRIYYPAQAQMHSGLADALLGLANAAAATDDDVAPPDVKIIEDVSETASHIQETAVELAETENLRQLRDIKQLFEQEQVSPYFEKLPGELQTAVDELLEQIDAKLDALGQAAKGATIDDMSAEIANAASIVALELKDAASILLGETQGVWDTAKSDSAAINAAYSNEDLQGLSSEYTSTGEKVSEINTKVAILQRLASLGTAVTQLVDTQIYTAERVVNISGENPIEDLISADLEIIFGATENVQTALTTALDINLQANELMTEATQKLFGGLKTVGTGYQQVYNMLVAGAEDTSFKDMLGDQTQLAKIFASVAADSAQLALQDVPDPTTFRNEVARRERRTGVVSKVYFGSVGLGSVATVGLTVSDPMTGFTGLAATLAWSMYAGGAAYAMRGKEEVFVNSAFYKLGTINYARYLSNPDVLQALQDPGSATYQQRKAAVLETLDNYPSIEQAALDNAENFGARTELAQRDDTVLSVALSQYFTPENIAALTSHSSPESLNSLVFQLQALQEISELTPYATSVQDVLEKVIIQFAAAMLNNPPPPSGTPGEASDTIQLASLATPLQSTPQLASTNSGSTDTEVNFDEELATLDDFMELWVSTEVAPLTSLVQHNITEQNATTDEEKAAIVSDAASDYGLHAADMLRDALNGAHVLNSDLIDPALDAIHSISSKMAGLVFDEAISEGYTLDEAQALWNETYYETTEAYIEFYGANIAEQLALAVMGDLGLGNGIELLAMADVTLAYIEKYDAKYGEDDEV